MGTFAAAALAALVGAAVFAVARVFARYPARPAGCRVLAAREVAFVEAAGLAMFPPGGDVAASATDAGVVSYLDGYLAALPPRQRGLIRALFLLMEQATLIFPAPGGGGSRRFSALGPAQRVAVLEGWQRSRLEPRRLAFMSLRSLLTMAYLASPKVLRELRLAPLDIHTPAVEADLLFPPVGAPPESVRVTRGDLEEPGGPPLQPDAPIHPAWREDA